jgi:hypothetical protein
MDQITDGTHEAPIVDPGLGRGGDASRALSLNQFGRDVRLAHDDSVGSRMGPEDERKSVSGYSSRARVSSKATLPSVRGATHLANFTSRFHL